MCIQNPGVLDDSVAACAIGYPIRCYPKPNSRNASAATTRQECDAGARDRAANDRDPAAANAAATLTAAKATAG